MRTFLRGKVTLLFMTLGLLLAVPAIAFADDIYNNVDTTVDATAEVMSLQVGATTGNTTQLAVITQNGDGKNGCNISGSGSSVTFPVSSSAPSVATVSPSSVTFNSCGATQTLTVTPLSQGSTTISLGTPTTTGGTTGTFNVAPATFTVNVTDPPPANTPPQVTVSGVTEGALYNKGSVPSATCQVIDAEDGNSSFAATLSAITGTYASDGIGSQTASCSYTDGGGLMASSSKTYSIVDPSAPVITKVVTPASPNGDNGWYKSGNVTVVWTVSDPESPNSIVKTGCVDQNITTDQAATTYSCSATSAGGSAPEQSVTIKRDATDPTINHTLSPAANGAGWNNTDVLVDYSCTDATPGSGVASCGPDETLSEGENQSSTGNATDNAGNTASDTVNNIDIDKTDPTVALVGGPGDGSSHYFGFVPDAPTCSASDALSLLAGPCTVSGYGTTVGHHTVTASATDNADNNAEASNSYDVLGWTTKGFYQPVDMNGVYNTVKGGSTVPLKFELFAGPTELTDPADVKSLQSQKITCTGTAVEDAIEATATGGTSLRYDGTGGQFIYNWKTPTGAGTCHKVTLTADDGSTIIAFFKMK